MSDQVLEQDQAETQENDQVVNQQDQENVWAKEKEALEAKYKKELQGLNRKVSEMGEAVKAKEREKMDAVEREKAELADLRAEKEKAAEETAQLRKQRIVDNALYKAGLPADLFGERIQGSTEDEILADVEAMKAFVTGLVDKGVESQTTELLKGGKLPDQSGDKKVMTEEEIEKLPSRAERQKARREVGLI